MEADNMIILKEYYARYLRDVRGLAESSIRHYHDALNHISRDLKRLNLVNQSIYEITDLEVLNEIKTILLADPDFLALDNRGNNMYSAGLNNYIRFAAGENFDMPTKAINTFDIPVKSGKPVEIKQTVWPRSPILRIQAISMAKFQCEINSSHESFISENTLKPYMEGHHAISMKHQAAFKNRLDIYANIICLCPVCHRKIHFGLISDRIDMMNQIYESRSDRLNKCGISISKEEFSKLAT